MNIGQKYKIRRSTKWFDNMWGDGYFRTVVFLDEYWFGIKTKTYKLFTYTKVPMGRGDWRYSNFYEIRYYPPPDAPTLEAIKRYQSGVIVGYRQSIMYSVRDFEIIDDFAYQQTKELTTI